MGYSTNFRLLFKRYAKGPPCPQLGYLQDRMGAWGIVPANTMWVRASIEVQASQYNLAGVVP